MSKGCKVPQGSVDAAAVCVRSMHTYLLKDVVWQLAAAVAVAGAVRVEVLLELIRLRLEEAELECLDHPVEH